MANKKRADNESDNGNKKHKDDGHMDVELFGDPDIVSAKLVEKCHDVTKDMGDVTTSPVEASKKGHIGFFGEGHNFLHDDQAALMQALAKVMMCEVKELDQGQLNECMKIVHLQDLWL